MSNITIFDIANAFLTFESMTHKKLQKLCYYAQSWHLVLFDKPLVDSEFQAWIHGPVQTELYNAYRDYGWEFIPQTESMPEDISNNEELKGLIDQVYRIYGELDGDQLETLTHLELPWKEARQGLQPWEASKNVISNNTIKEYYRKELEQGEYA